MINREQMKKLIGGLLIGGLMLGGGSFALAGTDATGTSTQANSTPPIHGPKMPGGERFGPGLNQTVIDALVTNGTLTQTQADLIKAKETQMAAARQTQMDTIKAMTKEERQAYRDQNKTGKVGLFQQLINDGSFTQAQVDTIQTAIRANMVAQREASLNTALSGLVGNNVITSDQSSAILEKINAEGTARQAQMAATKDMTQAERNAYRQNNKPEKVDMFAALVTSGTLTQTQADQVSKALHFQGGKDNQQGSGNGGKGFNGSCQKGVTAN
jgi:hypothetical protein